MLAAVTDDTSSSTSSITKKAEYLLLSISLIWNASPFCKVGFY